MERQLMEALQRCIMIKIDQENYGMLSRENYRFDDIKALAKAGIEWREGSTIRQNGIPVLKIQRRFAAKKVNGMYKELKPEFERITV